jgi:hypothetical protein
MTFPLGANQWRQSVLRVGDGRGFVVERDRRRYVVTAAHCLPDLPPAHGMSYPEERTGFNLLGQLGEKPNVAAEIVFVDPVAEAPRRVRGRMSKEDAKLHGPSPATWRDDTDTDRAPVNVTVKRRAIYTSCMDRRDERE